MLSLGLVLLALTTPPTALQPVSFNLDEQLRSHGYSTNYTWLVRRNSVGSRIYLFDWPEDRGVMIVEGGRIVRQMRRPAALAFLNEDEEFVAWSDDLTKSVTFMNGSRRDVHSSEFDVDPDGNYFVVGGGHGGMSEVGEIAHPTRTLAFAKIEAQRIFASDNRLYLLGSAADGSLVCQIYTLTDGHAILIDEKKIAGPSFHEILDMDPTTERVIYAGEGLFAGRRIIDLRTGRSERLGFTDQTTLFLQPRVMLGSH